jgi:CRISPR/Cas system CMR subunit Cmr6 (Cas7 group RAMP superfamily)
MSKTLKKNEIFLRFLLEQPKCDKQTRFLLSNPTNEQLQALTEIFHNILTNYNKFKASLQKLIQKKKRLITKFVKSYKKYNKKTQKKIILNNIKIMLYSTSY